MFCHVWPTHCRGYYYSRLAIQIYRHINIYRHIDIRQQKKRHHVITGNGPGISWHEAIVIISMLKHANYLLGKYILLSPPHHHHPTPTPTAPPHTHPHPHPTHPPHPPPPPNHPTPHLTHPNQHHPPTPPTHPHLPPTPPPHPTPTPTTTPPLPPPPDTTTYTNQEMKKKGPFFTYNTAKFVIKGKRFATVGLFFVFIRVSLDLKIIDFDWRRGVFSSRICEKGLFFKLGYEHGIHFDRKCVFFCFFCFFFLGGGDFTQTPIETSVHIQWSSHLTRIISLICVMHWINMWE